MDRSPIEAPGTPAGIVADAVVTQTYGPEAGKSIIPYADLLGDRANLTSSFDDAMKNLARENDLLVAADMTNMAKDLSDANNPELNSDDPNSGGCIDASP